MIIQYDTIQVFVNEEWLWEDRVVFAIFRDKMHRVPQSILVCEKVRLVLVAEKSL